MTCRTALRSLLETRAATQRGGGGGTPGASSRRAPSPTTTNSSALQNLKSAISRSTRSRGSEAGATTGAAVARVVGLVRPRPAEGRGRQGRVDQPVHRRLGRREPRAAVPDRHLPERERVADERGDAGAARDAPERSAGPEAGARTVGRG